MKTLSEPITRVSIVLMRNGVRKSFTQNEDNPEIL